MTKSRKHSRKPNTLKKIEKTTEKVIPVVGKGLKKLGNTAKEVVVKSAPVVEEGVSIVYGTLATGFDMGVKGVKSVAKGISKKKRSKRNRKHLRKTRRH